MNLISPLIVAHDHDDAWKLSAKVRSKPMYQDIKAHMPIREFLEYDTT